ncbi:hypothetical protein NL676_028423 [Syzygium grande]|nr:hypothetical protein NL676_028423 [Syzygium grande]
MPSCCWYRKQGGHDGVLDWGCCWMLEQEEAATSSHGAVWKRGCVAGGGQPREARFDKAAGASVDGLDHKEEALAGDRSRIVIEGEAAVVMEGYRRGLS